MPWQIPGGDSHTQSILLRIVCILLLSIGGFSESIGAQDDPFSDEPWTGGWDDSPPPVAGGPSSSIRFNIVPDWSGFRFHGPESVPIIEMKTRLYWTYRDDAQQAPNDSRGDFEDGALRIRGQFLDPNRLQVTLDLDGRHTANRVHDGWISRRVLPGVDLRLGLSRSSIGLDDSRVPNAGPFISSSLLGTVDRLTDHGVSLQGDWINSALSFDLGAYAGDGFGFRGAPLEGNSSDFRILLFPFQPGFIRPETDDDHPVLSSFFLITGGRWTSNWRGPIQIDGPGELPLLRSPEIAAKSRQAIRVGLGVDSGSVHLEAEWGYSGFTDVETPSGTEDLNKAIEGFRSELRWRPGYRLDSHRSRWNLSDEESPILNAGSGPTGRLLDAIEVNLRYENSNVGRKLIDAGLVSAGDAPSSVHSTTIALGFDLAPSARFTLEMSRSDSREPISAFEGKSSASTLAARIELGF